MTSEEAVPAPCSRTALVRDRYIDEIKAEMKNVRIKKVDEGEWSKVVARMKEREKNRMEYDKKDTTVTLNDNDDTITIEGNFVIIDGTDSNDDGYRVEGKRSFAWERYKHEKT